MHGKSFRSLAGAGALATLVLIAGCSSGGTPASPPGQAPTTEATSAAPRVTAPPSVTATGSAQPVQAKPTTVTLGGARLTLPAGWSAGLEHPTAHSSNMLPTWCLSPTPLPSPVYVGQHCAAYFSSVPAGIQVSVDTVGGIVSNPEFCTPGFFATNSLLDYRDAELGNRPADYRRWLFVCKDGARYAVEQYVADNAPGFIFGGDPDKATHEALTEIAKTAVLPMPAISAPLRLSGLGIVRTLMPRPGGDYQITLDRVVRSTTGLINNNPMTYTYDVPASVTPGGQPPAVGALVNVFTDGNHVTGYQQLPS